MRTVITLSQAQIDALPADKQAVFTALVGFSLAPRPKFNLSMQRRQLLAAGYPG